MLLDEVRLSLNLDKVGYKRKPDGDQTGGIQNRLGNGQRYDLTADELVAAIENGQTFKPGLLFGNEGNTWQSQQIIAVDVDNKDEDRKSPHLGERLPDIMIPDRAYEVLTEQYGIEPSIMYWTFSNTEDWPRFRILIIMDEPLTDKAEAKDLTLRVAGAINSLWPDNPEWRYTRARYCDTSIKDAARLLYGGRPGCVFHQSFETVAADALRALPVVEIQARTEDDTEGEDDTGNNRPRTSASPANTEMSEEYVREALDCLDPDMSYADWVRVGMALKSGGYSLDMWEDWSRGGRKYKRGDCAKRWKGFKTGGGTTMATLLYMAKQSGFEPSAAEKARFKARMRSTASEDFDTIDWDDEINVDWTPREEISTAASDGESVTSDTSSAGAAEEPPTSEAATKQNGESVTRSAEEPSTDEVTTEDGCVAYLRQAQAAILADVGFRQWLDKRNISPAAVKALGVGFDTARRALILPEDAHRYVAFDFVTGSMAYTGEPFVPGLHDLYDGREYVFVVSTLPDMLAMYEAGQACVCVENDAALKRLVEHLKAYETESVLLLAMGMSETRKALERRLKARLDREDVVSMPVNIYGGHGSPLTCLKKSRDGFLRSVENALREAAPRPDNIVAYLDSVMVEDLEQFKLAQERLTGFTNLDGHAHGIYSGLYVLAAITSLGKTTLAIQMADQLAAQGNDVVFFSLEQSRFEMVSKSLARLTAIDDKPTAVSSLSIRNGFTSRAVRKAHLTYRTMVGEHLSVVEGNFNCNTNYISEYVRRYQRRTGVTPIIFVDYLQILEPSPEDEKKSKREVIDLAVRGLKLMSRELNTPVIVISSVNRANYLLPFDFSSLKESGGIEYTADVVWGLQLACLDDPLFDQDGKLTEKRAMVNAAKEADRREIKFVCLKNRYGRSHYECNFWYYPANDLFMPAPDTTRSDVQRRLKRSK